MTRTSTERSRKLALAIGVASTAALATAVAAPAAQAAPFTCSASALSASLAGTALPLDQAFIPDGACTTREGGIPSIPANPLLSGGALNANSQASGTGASQTATAQGRVAALDVGSLASLGVPLNTITSQIPIPAQLSQPINLAFPAQATAALQPVITALQALAAVPVVGAGAAAQLAQLNTALTTGVSVNVGDTIRAALQLPDISVLHTGVASATATARCVDNRAVLSGSSEVASITALGQTLPTDDLGNQVLTLNTAAIDLSSLDLPAITLPAILDQALPGLTTIIRQQVLGALQTQLIDQIQANLPAGGIGIPASALNLTVSPKSTDASATKLTQRGPRLTLNVAGNPVLDLTLGTASVGSEGVDCSNPVPPSTTAPAQPPASGSAPSTSAPAASAAQQLLQCSERRLVLTNVLQRSNRVALFGVADKAFAGQTVQIRFNATKRDVTSAVVQPDGTFKATAPLPPAAIRSSNAARYQARIGTNKSLDLKLQRRMTVSNLDSANGMVTVKGKLTEPLPVGGASVLLSRRVSCNDLQPLKRVKADRNGNYEITVPAPVGESAVVYRLQSKVRNNPRNPKTFRTYTLPQGIDIAK